jgi:rubrerythrin
MTYTPAQRSETLAKVEAEIFDRMIPWEEIDREKAMQNPQVLDLLREACLVESYFAVYTAKMMRLFWYDVEATSMYTIEAFEAYTHFYKLRRYLEVVGYQPITDREVQALREKDLDEEYTDEVRELVNFMGTEHFANHFFNDLVEMVEEPVLRKMLPRMAKEEVSHAAFATDLLSARLKADPTIREDILRHAADFLHVGKYAMPQVRNAREDPVSMIRGFDERIKELTGTSLTEYLRDNHEKK